MFVVVWWSGPMTGRGCDSRDGRATRPAAENRVRIKDESDMQTETRWVSLTEIWRLYGRPRGKRPNDYLRRGPGRYAETDLPYLYDLPDSNLVRIAIGYGTWRTRWSHRNTRAGSRGSWPKAAGTVWLIAGTTMRGRPPCGCRRGPATARSARETPPGGRHPRRGGNRRSPSMTRLGMCPDGGQPWLGDPCYEFLVTPDYSGDLVAVAC